MTRNNFLPFCDKYNINLEYLELCRDFISTVINKILTTYLGSEYMDSNEICNNHFNFWWEKMSNIFKHFTNIDFNLLSKAKEYFKKIIFRMLYNSKLDNMDSIIKLSVLSIFNFNEYNEKDYDVILSVKKLFEINE